MADSMQQIEDGRLWYAVWTKSRQEKVAAAMLSGLGVQHFLPLKSELRQWSDRRQRVEVPLFSGYLFVRIDLSRESKLQVLKVPGIGAIVGNQNGSLAIPDRQIEDIRTVLAYRDDCSAEPFDPLQPGERVRIRFGPLAGVEGILSRSGTGPRLILSVEMIRQSLTLNVTRDEVELLGDTTPSRPFPTDERIPIQPVSRSLRNYAR